MKAVVLAAGFGKRLRPITDKIPKFLIEVNGRPLIEHYLSSLRKQGINDILVVVGHLADLITKESCFSRGEAKFIFNPDYKLGNVTSLYACRDFMRDECILMDGDVYFEDEVLSRLVKSSQEHCFLLDSTVRPTGEEMVLAVRQGRVVAISRHPQGDFDLTGEGVGFLKLSSRCSRRLIGVAGDFILSGREDSEYEECLGELLKEEYFGYEPIDGLKWTEIDFPEDIDRANRLSLGERLGEDS